MNRLHILRRGLTNVVAVLTVVCAASTLTSPAPAAAAAPGPGVVHTIRNIGGEAARTKQPFPQVDVCLDADKNTIGSNGTKIQLWECNDSTQQDWYYQPVNGTDAVIKNTRAGSGFCLDANVNEIGQNGTHVTLWGCNGSTQQLWRGFGGQTITNVRAGTGFCLDANVHSIAQNGTPMSLWGCNASSQQHWYLSVPYTRTCKNQGFTKNGRADFSSTGGNGIHVDIINASLSAVNVGVTFTNGNQVFNGVIGGGGQTTFAASSSGNTPLTYFLTAFLGGPNIGTVNFTVRSSVC